MEKIKSIIKKFCTKEVISYIIFGILTTLVNITISFVLTTACKIEGNLSSTIGIICIFYQQTMGIYIICSHF